MRFFVFCILIHFSLDVCPGQVPLFQNRSDIRIDLPSGTSPQLRRILGVDGNASPSDRIREAERLSILSDSDIEAILSYIETRVARSAGVFQNNQLEHQLRNTLMNRLYQSPVEADRLATCFSEVIADRETDVVLRDYATQHLGNLVSRDDCSATLRNEIFDGLFGLMSLEHDSSVAGAAVIALGWNWKGAPSDQGAHSQGFPKVRLMRSCEALGKNEEALVGNRAAAVAVAGEIIAADGVPIPDWIFELLATFQPSGTGLESLKTRTSEESGEPKSATGTEGKASLLLACAHVIVQSGESDGMRHLNDLIQALQGDTENRNSVFLSKSLLKITESEVSDSEMDSVLP